ncbi:MAG: hypothetical protein R3C99_01165 [Pirellulaceae bacterium]|nr:hypothetical protein [Planctomycetales bacterium]MCA9208145.1 hypothetical protein [Planctomycetales bacterium]
MFRFPKFWMLAVGCCLAMPFVGCNSATQDAPQAESETDHDHAGHDHGHDEGHDHGHSHEALGPHGGHLLELGQEQYHAEWTHDENAKSVTVYFLDGEAKESVAVEPESAKIEVVIEGKEPTTYNLKPVGEGADAGYEHQDGALLTGLNMVGHGVQAKLMVTIEGQPFEAEFQHLEHDHGHDHGHAH